MNYNIKYIHIKFKQRYFTLFASQNEELTSEMPMVGVMTMMSMMSMMSLVTGVVVVNVNDWPVVHTRSPALTLSTAVSSFYNCSVPAAGNAIASTDNSTMANVFVSTTDDGSVSNVSVATTDNGYLANISIAVAYTCVVTTVSIATADSPTVSTGPTRISTAAGVASASTFS